MPLVAMRQLLDEASSAGYGVGAFNVNNMEQIQAIMEAARETESPVIVRASRGARAYNRDELPVALVWAAIWRPAAVDGNTVPINLVAPGQVWGDRVNALDLRFAKILRFGRARNTIGIDIYNVTNSAAILTYNQSFNPAATTGSQAWLAPLSVLTPRFLKIGVQIDF